MNTKTTQLGFILGRDNALSIAEIFAYLSRMEIKYLSAKSGKDYLILEIDEDKAHRVNLNQLGGTIKVFEVIGTALSQADISALLAAELPKTSHSRINFGVSGYSDVPKKLILDLGYELKNTLIANGMTARFVTGKTSDLSSVIVNENKLIEKGLEAIIIADGHDYIIGKTIAVQDYKAYSKRDFGRPKRDDRNGMLPPKLAQILINLACKPVDASIYDPFCGSGTILQEALFMGYRSLYASDIEPKNIDDTKTNLEWLFQAYGMPRIAEENIFVSDVLNLTHPLKNPKAFVIPAKAGIQETQGGDGSLGLRPGMTIENKNDNLADAIIGEGNLGEPTRRTKAQAQKDTENLAGFYLEALPNLAKSLKHDGKIVLAIPFFVVDKEYHYLDILDKLKEISLEVINPIPAGIDVKLHGRGNLTYSRPDQFVGREILILQKSN